MYPKPVRYQSQHSLHFITFSCYRRMKLLDSGAAREIFEDALERVRRWYGCYITGYVVMPEHVHLLISEPERGRLAVVVQMLKQITSRKLRPAGLPHFWQVRYYDFPVWSERKRAEKLRYMHRNPVERGLAARPEDWKWSSFLHYATGVENVVEIESQWTARRRERLGVAPLLPIAHPPAKDAGRVGQPQIYTSCGKDGPARPRINRQQNFMDGITASENFEIFRNGNAVRTRGLSSLWEDGKTNSARSFIRAPGDARDQDPAQRRDSP